MPPRRRQAFVAADERNRAEAEARVAVPQQPSGSVDCAMYMLSFIERATQCMPPLWEEPRKWYMEGMDGIDLRPRSIAKSRLAIAERISKERARIRKEGASTKRSRNEG